MRPSIWLLGMLIAVANTSASSTELFDAASAPVASSPLHFDFEDAKPPRAIDVEVWYPSARASGKDASRSGPYPLLLYFPGWGAKVSVNASLLAHLASRGFVVVGVSYPSGAGLPDPAVPMKFAPDESYATGTAQGDTMVRIEAEDASLVLDKMTNLTKSDPGYRLTHMIDTTRVGVLGYSLGGSVAAQAALRDAHFKAVMNLDGWMFGDVATGFFSQPYLVISDDLAPATAAEMASSDAFTRNFSRLRDRDKKHQTAQLEKSHGFRITITGASHFSFSDEAKPNQNNAGPIDPRRALFIVGAYAADFFGRYLAGRSAPPLDPAQKPFPEATLEAFPSRN